MKSVFLFGAGAEAGYGLKQGAAFSEALLCNRYLKERRQLLGEDYSQYQLVYKGSQKVFLQTISLFIDEAKEALGSEIAEKCKSYYRNNGKRNPDKHEIIKQLCDDWYDIVVSRKDCLLEKNQKIRTFFLENAVFFDSLDEKFNSLREPHLTQTAKRVINAYATIFVLMMEDLYDEQRFCSWRLGDVIRVLQDDYSKIDYYKESYYSILKQYGQNYEIVTTNYTNIVNRVTQKEVAFLHGNLNWFEDAKRLTVLDCTVETEREQLLATKQEGIFPFILIPSGVKPIICARQIEQFHKMIEWLDQAQVLCVVGYRFNSEDNHVNSIMADWLRKPRHVLIYLNFENSLNWKTMQWSSEFTKETLSYQKIESYFKYTNEWNLSIINVDVDRNNALQTYESIVKLLAREEMSDHEQVRNSMSGMRSAG